MNSNNLFRKLSSLVKLRFLPNVSHLNIHKEGYDPYAMVFGIIKVTRTMRAEKLRKISICNAYLRKQYVRLYYLAITGNYSEFQRVADFLLRKSLIFRLVAIHHVDKNWYIKKETAISKLAKKLRTLIDKEDTYLEYNRVWIDKNPGDFKRPLGAPKLHWKVILLMRLQLMEIFYCGIGMLQPWQHAGVSKKGLVTAWESVITKALKYPVIYEFDIKGFFNMISNQNAIPELPKWNKWFNIVSNTRPSSYTLPLEQDCSEVSLAKSWFMPDVNWRYPQIGEAFWYSVVRAYNKKDEVNLNKTLAITSKYLEGQNPVKLNGKIYYRIAGPDATNQALGMSRDKWNSLMIPNKGFPQGANTSPFLSCLQLMRIVGHNDNLIMYMDDGLIFGNSIEEVEGFISKFKSQLRSIGCRLAPEKSRYIVKGDGKITKSKFLGIETDGAIFKSKTRSGTEMLFNSPITVAEYESLSSYLSLSPSASRVVEWIEHCSKDRIKGLEWAISKGFLSNIIAISMDSEQKGYEKGLEGNFNKLEELTLSEGFIKFVRKELMEQFQRGDIKIHSTYAVLKLLKVFRKAKTGKRILKF